MLRGTINTTRKGNELTVSDKDGERFIALGIAEKVDEAPAKPQATQTKRTTTRKKQTKKATDANEDK